MSRLYYVTEAQVLAYEAVYGVFAELFKELKELGKKKPEATLSAAKVKLINRVLDDVRKALKDAPDAKYLDSIDDQALPQFGDAILILSQYEGALKSFKERHYGYRSSHGTGWVIRDQ
ncbi:hypothetical protein FZ934_04285 [Rhizobium grahamii]|uniref:Uncharacterized protein n=1 Tax=Rhizobium grahamii TaxID=1120045 RepID=A0A5Q0C6Q8_9HYPH|nr:MULTISPECIES: hypothetical protein [Rhizobium]QFY59717.1 hypothetical protein FZ934_04285 [Rhizobium grahamii]QRM51170.1 hypothetical protein F3Y33_18605 [Rhizobium sp. BG6]